MVPLDSPPVRADMPVCLGALGPWMLALAGRIADGVVLNLMSPAQAGQAADIARAAGDLGTLREIYAPDAVLWHNDEQIEQASGIYGISRNRLRGPRRKLSLGWVVSRTVSTAVLGTLNAWHVPSQPRSPSG